MAEIQYLAQRSLAFPMLRYIGPEMPPVIPGEIIVMTNNFRICTEMAGKDGKFVIMPTSREASDILCQASLCHNIYSFDIKPVPTTDGVLYFPCLQADYSAKNAQILFMEQTAAPGEKNSRIPSPARMEQCLSLRPYENWQYRFSENGRDPYPHDYVLRHLKLISLLYADGIPDHIIHSRDPNPWYKARKGWFQAVALLIELAIEQNLISATDILQQCENIREFIYSPGFHEKSRITEPADIEWANRVIKAILYP